MKALVTAKRVVDYSVKVLPKSDGTGADIARARMTINPFDEIATDEAVRLKEKGAIDSVTAISIGPAACEEILRGCYAMGVDRAILIEREEYLAPLDVARALAAIVDKEKPDLVIMGKQAIDDDCNQTGQMLAGLLGWPQATFCSEIRIADGEAECARETDRGIVRVRCRLPCVLTCDLRLNVPRRPSLPNVMKARAKTVERMAWSALGLSEGNPPRAIRVEAPAHRAKGIKVKGVEQFIDELIQRGVWPK
ncbi:MAG: electron transfer flavoprotein subunit beta/FixA family protein [Rickettsiales bacterium]